ncbi:hypothetical protein M8J77_014260 [Diaphorina citri]|nr:hypothetical protein M8J77_014260 [Diaphorina citri]
MVRHWNRRFRQESCLGISIAGKEKAPKSSNIVRRRLATIYPRLPTITVPEITTSGEDKIPYLSWDRTHALPITIRHRDPNSTFRQDFECFICCPISQSSSQLSSTSP